MCFSHDPRESAATRTTTQEAQQLPLLDKPKRPRTAYNYFFQAQRAILLAQLPVRAEGQPRCGSHGKLGFSEMAHIIAAKWKALNKKKNDKGNNNNSNHDDELARYICLANADKLRYVREKAEYQAQLILQQQQQIQQNQPSLSHDVAADTGAAVTVVRTTTNSKEDEEDDIKIKDKIQLDARGSVENDEQPLSLPQLAPLLPQMTPLPYSHVTDNTTARANRAVSHMCLEPNDCSDLYNKNKALRRSKDETCVTPAFHSNTLSYPRTTTTTLSPGQNNAITKNHNNLYSYNHNCIMQLWEQPNDDDCSQNYLWNAGGDYAPQILAATLVEQTQHTTSNTTSTTTTPTIMPLNHRNYRHYHQYQGSQQQLSAVDLCLWKNNIQ